MISVSNRYHDPFADIRPLEAIAGFLAAEQAYDRLDHQEQIIIDLLCVGWTFVEIAALFGASQSWVSTKVGRIRFKLADSTLRITLEARMRVRDGMHKEWESEV